MEKKIRLIRILSLLSALEGAGALYLLAASPSMERNALLWGYSAARLGALAATLGLTLIVALGLAGLAPARRAQRLERALLADGWLYPACLALAALLAGALLLLGVTLGVHSGPLAGPAAGLRRILPLPALAGLLCAQTLLGLGLAYRAHLNARGLRASLPQVYRRLFVGLLPLWAALLFLLLSAAVFWVFSPAQHGRVPGHDSGIFLYFGERINAGALPYRDLWDHKPPLIFYIDALGLRLGQGVWGVWALEWLSLALAAAAAYRLLHGVVRPWAQLVGVAALVMGFARVFEGGNLTEEFALPLQFASLLLMLRLARGRGRWPAALGWGVLLGTSLMLKQTTLGVWLAMLLVYAYLRGRAREPFPWAEALAAAGGLGLVAAGWVAYLASRHILWDFWDVAYRYNFLYSDISPQDRLRALGVVFEYLRDFSGIFWFGMAVFVVALARLALTRRRPPVLLRVALLDVPIEIGLIGLSGENYFHYFLTLLPAMVILGAYGADGLAAWLVQCGHPVAGAAGAGGAAALILAAGFGFLWQIQHSPPEVFIPQVVDYVREHTQEGDTLVMWGSQTTINYLSGRQAPTRFVHQKPLFRAGYASDALSAEMLADLQRRPPALIIQTFLGSTPFVSPDSQGGCSLPAGSYSPHTVALFEYICDHYRFTDTLGKDQWQVFTRRL
ncbi:MAG: glycosyltransferase family 39 protein [Anaerolineaceae bacterium]|nr:glycosyltransferase family 39 protein [Anaerolineaceae bacterium]